MGLHDILAHAVHSAGLHRISTRPCPGRVRVVHDGVLLAESDRALELRETGAPTRLYLPREDVRMDLLAPSATTSHCPFKGDAVYFSAPGGADAFWSYAAPPAAEAAPIAGMLAPRAGPVEVILG